MAHGDICVEDDLLYVKWEERGVLLCMELSEETKTAEIESPDFWYYPKINPVSKRDMAGIREAITLYYSGLGYTVRFISTDSE